jgi:hypothetical protein
MFFVVGFSWLELLSFDKITNCVFLWFSFVGFGGFLQIGKVV